MCRHELTDEEWAVIQPLLPNKPRGVPRVDDRRVLNGILWRFRTGAPWRDVPERYGPRTTLYNRFVRWRAAGVWDRILKAVAAAYDGDIVMIDSSCVRVHQHGASGKRGGAEDGRMGRSRGGLTTKIHALVDAEGRPVRLELTAGQAGDAPAAEGLLEELSSGATLIADRAYGHQCDPRLRRRPRRLGEHPAPQHPQASVQLQRLGLPAAQPRRALLQPHQALPRPRHPLRQASRQLPRRPQARRNPHLACCIMSPRPSIR